MAPNPTPLQDFEYHWKLVKSFYTKTQEKIHIDDTNIPIHLEKMLEILIKEDSEDEEITSSPTSLKPCFEFILVNRPLDLLVDLAAAEQPAIGIRSHVLCWIKRLLTCLKNPQLEHASIFQPIQKVIQLCNGMQASPYDMEEILLLETVSGLIRKDSILINLFIPTHQHSHLMNDKIKRNISVHPPKKNSLFDENSTKLESNIRRVELMTSCNKSEDEKSEELEKVENLQNCDKRIEEVCDCDEGERFTLLDAILSYLESAVSFSQFFNSIIYFF